ncbi:MAG: hypothetical protein ACFCUI_06795 [Bernardetiaceae bacterium]
MPLIDDLAAITGKVYRKLTAAQPPGLLTDADYPRPILSAEAGNSAIREAIATGKPFVAARYGGVELQIAVEHLEWKAYQQAPLPKRLSLHLKKDRRSHFRPESAAALGNNAGFFPLTLPHLERYAELLIQDTGLLDLLGIWRNTGEDTMSHQYAPQTLRLFPPKSLEPYYHDQPWSTALSGKKVLVIHPYKKSILTQYQKRTLLFTDPNILPAFDLRVVQAVQSIAGTPTSFKDWFEALQYMKQKIEETDFDVLLVGAGAYGFHLAVHAKRIGRQGIHIGGATQILFGIKGSRWDQHPVISKFYNEHWQRPLPEEVPEGFRKVEGGCYW